MSQQHLKTQTIFYPEHEYILTEINELKRTFYEKNSYEELLAYLINHNKINSQDYISLWGKYLKAIECLNIAKINFENAIKKFFLTENYTLHSWHCDFLKGEFTFYEEIC